MKPSHLCLCGTLIFTLTTPVHAYQYSAILNYEETSVDFDTNLRADRDISEFQIAGTFYFNDVDDSTGPRQMAPFLSRQSHLSVSGSNGDMDFGTFKLDLHRFNVGGSHHFGSSGWLAGAGFGRSTVENTVDTTYESLRLYLGKYLTEHSRLIGRYKARSTESRFVDQDDTEFGVGFTYYQPLSDSTFYDVDLTVDYTDADDGDDAIGLGVSGTYYPSPFVGIEAAYAHSFGDFTDFTTYQVGIEWYLSDHIATGVGYQYQSIKNDSLGSAIDDSALVTVDTALLGVPDGDSHRFNIGVKFRF